MKPRMKESQIQSAVIEHWRMFGLPNTLVAAIPNQRAHGQAGLTAGIYDLLVLAPLLPVGFLELKTETGTLSVSQKAFGAICAVLGIPNAVAYGRDEPIRILEQWNVVRKTNVYLGGQGVMP